MAEGYEHDTYGHFRSGSERSAQVVAELLTGLLKPQSVLDVGCGTGGWLEAFRALGVETVHGVDGTWAPARAALRPSEFTACNFEQDDPGNLSLPKDKFDLVISLEFLEHVSAERADSLASFLASKGDTILLSAAIPLQGGQHHVNERWPEYWAAKLMSRGFVPFDAMRLSLWNEPRVESWYRQNMMLYFRGDIPQHVRQWGEDHALRALGEPRAIVHPEFYAKRLGRLEYALTHPVKFLGMLIQERKSGKRNIPPIDNLDRE